MKPPLTGALAATLTAIATAGAADPGGLPAELPVTLAGTQIGLEPVHVPMHMERGRPVAEVTVAGQGPYPFVVDTGAGAVILAPRLVEDLGLESEGTQRVGDPSDPGAIEADTFTLPEFRIGEARFEGVEAISWPGDMLERSLGSARGIIGLPVFADCLVTLDFPGERLTIRRGALGPADGSVAYELDGWVPALALRIADTTVDVHLDTGNPGVLVLPDRIAADLDFAAPPRVVGRARTASGAFVIKRAPLKATVHLAGREVALPTVDLTDRFDHANAGSGLLSRFALTIDQTNRRLLLAPPDLTPGHP